MALMNDDELMGLEIVDFDPERGLESPRDKAYRVRYGWRGASLTDRFEQLMADPRAGELRALVIGLWEHDGSDDVPGMLRAAAPRLTALEALFVGDIAYEENEISWIEQFELGALVGVFPKLKHFKVRGGNGLGLAGMTSQTLEALIVETGGLDRGVVAQIAAAKLPELRHLEVWTGSSEYGADVSLEDMMPLVVGTAYPEMRYPFPKLKRLGLVNSELADELAEALRDAPIVGQLDVLDLSRGILTSRGAAALLESDKVAGLKTLILDNTFVTQDDVERLEAKGLTVSAEQLREADEDGDDVYYYVETGE